MVPKASAKSVWYPPLPLVANALWPSTGSEDINCDEEKGMI
jgi:hypothetical protein